MREIINFQVVVVVVVVEVVVVLVMLFHSFLELVPFSMSFFFVFLGEDLNKREKKKRTDKLWN